MNLELQSKMKLKLQPEISIKIEFDSSHRVIGHNGKCKLLHGHRYVLIVSFTSKKLTKEGFVEDFSVLKSYIKEWIDIHFDHNCILSREDKILGESIASITKQKIYYLDSNPTVENILIHLAKKLPEVILPIDNINSLVISELQLYETPNCSAKINL